MYSGFSNICVYGNEPFNVVVIVTDSIAIAEKIEKLGIKAAHAAAFSISKTNE